MMKIMTKKFNDFQMKFSEIDQADLSLFDQAELEALSQILDTMSIMVDKLSPKILGAEKDVFQAFRAEWVAENEQLLDEDSPDGFEMNHRVLNGEIRPRDEKGTRPYIYTNMARFLLPVPRTEVLTRAEAQWGCLFGQGSRYCLAGGYGETPYRAYLAAQSELKAQNEAFK